MITTHKDTVYIRIKDDIWRYDGKWKRTRGLPIVKRWFFIEFQLLYSETPCTLKSFKFPRIKIRVGKL